MSVLPYESRTALGRQTEDAPLRRIAGQGMLLRYPEQPISASRLVFTGLPGATAFSVIRSMSTSSATVGE